MRYTRSTYAITAFEPDPHRFMHEVKVLLNGLGAHIVQIGVFDAQ